jgi:hypothetical protein
MIVSLVQESCELMREVNEREQAKAEAQSVEDTRHTLSALGEDVRQLHASIQFLGLRLPPSERASVLRVAERCVSQLNHSAEQFLTQPRQKSEIQAIHSQVRKALESVYKAWQSYARECIREPFDLYRLVCSLPEVAVHKATYDELQSQLQAASASMPSSAFQVQAFDRALAQFTQQLHEIEGLSEAVKVFLLKTLAGTASLADLSDEVLQWGRQGRRAQAFSIQFAR